MPVTACAVPSTPLLTSAAVRTMADVKTSARATLGPFDRWLRSSGERVEAAGRRMGAAVPDVGAWASRLSIGWRPSSAEVGAPNVKAERES
eukprot:115060-Prymnesium_polylepis.2